MRCPRCHRRLAPGTRCPRHPADAPPAPAVAAPAPSDGADPPVRELAGYRLLRRIGSGGFAEVYLARALADGAPAAVKLARARRDPRLLREVEMLRRVGPPAAPRCIAEGALADGRPYLIEDFAGAESLAHRLAARACDSAPDPRAALALALALCDRVAQVHAAGIVHRDLKPENLILGAEGGVTVLDFGLACASAQSTALAGGGDGEGSELGHADKIDPAAAGSALALTRPGEVLGTPHYMAPEQWLAEPLGASADVYALGVLLFELFTGQPPFAGDEATLRRAHVHGRCPLPSSRVPALAAVDAIVLRCLAKRPEDRFADAGELAAALRALRPAFAADPDTDAVAAATPSATDAAPPNADAERAPTPSAQRPTALLGLAAAVPALTVQEQLRAHGAVLAARVGAVQVFVFPGSDAAARAVRCALRAAHWARARAGLCGAAVVHLAELRVRQRGQRIRASGPALVELGWWHAGQPTPADAAGERAPAGEDAVVLSDAAAALLDPAEVQALAPGRWRPLREPLGGLASAPDEPPLCGREAVVAALLRAARGDERARARGDERESARGDGYTPALLSVLGDAGMGKTRVLAAVARLLRADDGPALTYLRGGPEATAALVRALAPQWTPPSDAPSEDDQVSEDAAGDWALAYALGLAAAEHPAVRAILAAPGALRQATARGLARVLRAAASGAGRVLLLDDAHRAEHALLDAIELATRTPAAAPLAIIAAAPRSFTELRPRWGDRALHAATHELSALGDADARALLHALLRPVEFVPEAVTARLHALSGGVPLYLVELARALREGGAIRRHPGLPGFYLAGDELLHVTSTPLIARLAARLREAAPTPLRPLIDLCALLGARFAAADVVAIQRRADAAGAGAAAGALDAAAALERLVHTGVLRREDAALGFRHPLFAQALAARIPAPTRRLLHAAASAHFEAHPERASGDARAHHARASGDAERAAALHLELAEDARHRHRYVAAEQHYSAALELTDPGEEDLAVRLLAGRGSVRYRLQRFEDALADLRRARARAETRGERRAVIALLLEESTVLDWCQSWPASAELAERARALLDQSDAHEARLRAAAALARGRALYRRECFAEAAEHLELAERTADAADAPETALMAALLRATALAYLDRLDESERSFASILARCRLSGDDFHRAAAHINRQILWMKRQQVEPAVADLEICIELGQVLGHAQLERGATFNLAELLSWCGQRQRARDLAERSRALQMRFFQDHAFHDDALLLARIDCVHAPESARDHLAWLERCCDLDALPPSAELLLAMVRLALQATSPARSGPWRELAERAAAVTGLGEHVEILVSASERALVAGDIALAADWYRDAEAAAAGSRIWAERLAALAARCGLPRRQHLRDGERSA
ncbi:serine/threonine-protein kinase [Haliangium ochraceum]|uniref:non-specific serine/threonine protein kinase n=1 Tax=Haliangium ochraceum (strain DSM 14365 / JCM 11303 / SMP-2) TaxID=502025 RepID=D0LME0_HALO1|nr:serine/threonine-protein kinase [Haliangium ochraceum]ACY16846.1 serine/threonine protein kinase [Haliangium ochraceum DSM 14365]